MRVGALIMPAQARIRVSRQPADRAGRALSLVSAVYVAYVAPTGATAPPALPQTFCYTVAAAVPIPSLLARDFTAANPGVAGATSAGANSLALLPKPPRLHLSVEPRTFAELGLVVSAKAQAGHRTRGAARGARVAVSVPAGASASSAVAKRAAWALAPDRVGTVDMSLSCGAALVLAPVGAGSMTRVDILPERRSIMLSAVFDAATALARASSCDDELLDLVEAAQALAMRAWGAPELCMDSTFVEGGGVCLHAERYVGVCNDELPGAAVATARKHVETGTARFAVVMAVGAPAPKVWARGGGRDRGAASPGFDGDCAEVCVVVPNMDVVSFELRAACDL